MKKAINKLINMGRIIKRIPPTFSNFFYDIFRFIHYSSTYKTIEDERYLLTSIMSKTHSLEKRLAFSNANNGRGAKVAFNLLKSLELYKASRYREDLFILDYAISILWKYYEKLPENDKNKRRAKVFIGKKVVKDIGGVREYSVHELSSASCEIFKDFFNNRHSIRDFTDKKVAKETILKALEIARNAPSLCNRQPARIYVLESDSIRKDAVNILSGISGFKEKIYNLCIVTADIGKLYNINERNEGYTNGGIFLLSLLLSFHSLGIAACVLNWDVDWFADFQIRRKINLKKSESIIAFVAFGYMPQKCLIPISLRLSPQDLVTFI